MSKDKPTADKKPNEVVVTLSDGREVKVRKPKLRDIRAHFNEENLEERQLLITGTLVQLTSEEMDDLDYADALKLKEAAESFLL